MKPSAIELLDGTSVPILYEDRSVLAIDKPAGWMLAPATWDKTSRNLQRELMISIQAGEHWARSRNLKYIRFIHRLDAETSGVLLLAKSAGAVRALSELFESRLMRKKYLAVVHGIPAQPSWVCQLRISQEPGVRGQMTVDARLGKDAETAFRVLLQGQDTTLIEATPLTGRTHQIRVHLAAEGHPVLGDTLYGGTGRELALRAVELSYTDPFQKRPVRILAPTQGFLRRHHFAATR
ncbi:MAG TPA: RluA family pseudouridine synthase [Verrucomicrobiae bacterium]|nr:RluA family pseudouridine synthase [Verrucomicrobiae bacterium]